MRLMLPVVPRDFAQERLELIFPKEAFGPGLSSALAAAAVAGLIWADCVMPYDEAELDMTLPYARPTTILWMNEELIRFPDDAKRASWYSASLKGKTKAHALMNEWGAATSQWYADNTRESVRDDVYHVWTEHGAMLAAPHVPTTSSAARWILRRSFAELFSPELVGDNLIGAVDAWSHQYLSRSGRVRASLARSRAKAAVSVRVAMPDGTQRSLTPGNSSLLLQGVIEGWAALRLREPAVLTISESGDKVFIADAQRLATVGISISVSTLLPDALIVDLLTDPLEFWVIEVVATGGPINERRKSDFLRWADSQGIPSAQLRFLSAFLSRQHAAAKRYVPELASGTYAWFLDEPDQELLWSPIESSAPQDDEKFDVW